jgi:hypothetical protein
MIVFKVCRARDRQINWEGHFEGQTVSQLHQNTPQALRTPRNQQTARIPCPFIHLTADPALLVASQLSLAQRWVHQDNPRCPATISTRANCKMIALLLQQWQISAKCPLNPDLVKASMGTDVLKLHRGLRKTETLLTI